jgi:hypothetical protein
MGRRRSLGQPIYKLANLITLFGSTVSIQDVSECETVGNSVLSIA